MDQHPIEGIMETTMENIKNMVDVNTIVGESVVMADGTVIIPVSRIGFGFVTGGGEYDAAPAKKPAESTDGRNPFAGGSGAGISVVPVAFLVAGNGHVQLLPVSTSSPYERLIDIIPEIMNDIKTLWQNPSNQGQTSQGRRSQYQSDES